MVAAADPGGGGGTLKLSAAVDRVSRYCVAMPSSKVTARSAARFLDQAIGEMPFPVRAIQVDGGSEFMALHSMKERAKSCGEKTFG